MTIARSFGPVAEQMKQALESYSKEELIDLMTHIVKTYVVEGTMPLKSESAPQRGAEERLAHLTFPQVILHLQMRLDHREWNQFSVSGEDVWVTAQGQRVNLTGGISTPAAAPPVPEAVPAPSPPRQSPGTQTQAAPPSSPPPAAEAPTAPNGPPSGEPPEPFADDVDPSERFGMLEID